MTFQKQQTLYTRQSSSENVIKPFARISWQKYFTIFIKRSKSLNIKLILKLILPKIFVQNYAEYKSLLYI